ncbi:putative toxin-antitoxin system, toxin component, RelE family [Leptospira santarosai str. JET]|nr:putative toxin-antitoxin system, toxin component, RelE family [Leptospira santarosai str. JET]
MHPLIKDRDGQHAIWVNSAVRICFTWNDGKVIIEYVGNYH